MFTTASKIEEILVGMQEHDEVAATVIPPHGKKKKHKLFWNLYNQLQEAVVDHFRFLETYSEPDYKLPFNSEGFDRAWIDWQIYFLEETGKHLGKIRGKKQVTRLAQLYEAEEDAKKALDYFINKGYTFIFKINKENGKQSEDNTGTHETDWDNIKD